MNRNNFNLVHHTFQKQKFKKHFHTSYSIGLILDGVHKLELEDNRFAVSRGKIKIINPYETHVADGDSVWKYLNIMPDIQSVTNIAEDLCEDTIDCAVKFQHIICDARANQYFLNLYHSKNSQIEYDEIFVIFLSYLLRHYAHKELKKEHNSKNIQKSIEFIHDNFLENISLDMLCMVSNISKYHLIRVFKSQTGLSPYQYILSVKIEYGMQLLKKGLSLSEIAVYSGFSDQSHFIKTFKHYYGFTPSAYMH